jgi:hypothetical protein
MPPFMSTPPFIGIISSLNYQNTEPVTVGTSSAVLVAAGQFRRSLVVQTLPGSTTNVWLNPSGAPAVVGSGCLVSAGGGSFTFGSIEVPMPAGEITAITDGETAQGVALAGG